MLSQMGNCLKSNNQGKKDEIVICVVGLDEAGKTTAIKVIKGDNNIKDVTPTVGFEPYEFNHNSRNVLLYDLGGSARVRDIWKHYLAESYGFIFVVDCSNRSRVFECSKVFSSFVENDKVSAKPILILGNKQDMPNALDESEIVQFLNVEDLVNKYQIPCRIETCQASLGTGNKLDDSIKFGFEWLLKYIVLKYDELKTRVDYDVKMQKNKESKIKLEKQEKIKQSREADRYSNYDQDDMDKNTGSPWKPLSELKLKDMKSKSISSEASSKLSSYEKQLLEDMKRDPSPQGRGLSTIDEEKQKLKNKFLKSNKLVPLDDRSDFDNKPIRPDHAKSWAVTEYSSSLKPIGLDRPRRFDD